MKRVKSFFLRRRRIFWSNLLQELVDRLRINSWHGSQASKRHVNWKNFHIERALTQLFILIFQNFFFDNFGRSIFSILQLAAGNLLFFRPTHRRDSRLLQTLIFRTFATRKTKTIKTNCFCSVCCRFELTDKNLRRLARIRIHKCHLIKSTSLLRYRSTVIRPDFRHSGMYIRFPRVGCAINSTND